MKPVRPSHSLFPHCCNRGGICHSEVGENWEICGPGKSDWWLISIIWELFHCLTAVMAVLNNQRIEVVRQAWRNCLLGEHTIR